MQIKRLDSDAADFAQSFASLQAGQIDNDEQLRAQVAAIIARVRSEGDSALLAYTQQFDDIQAASVAELCYQRSELQAQLDKLPREQAQALQFANKRIRAYHEHQISSDWQFAPDVVLGQRVVPLARVGVYAPGGRACYPSSVLMSSAVADIAGVGEITVVSPKVSREHSAMLLAAAYLGGASQVISIGGAQAIAALAYGSESIAAVNKITGPGNKYVAEAKRQVFGRVGIDMVAGPSEVVIVADASAPVELIIADMLAQAEHDPDARAILLSPSAALLNQVQELLPARAAAQPRQSIIAAALADNSALIHTRDIAHAVLLADELAPEHLQLMLEQPQACLDMISNAGAVFLGSNCAEVLGDYCAGSNHVLPTGGAGRYAQALGVYDFVKRVSFIDASNCPPAKLTELAHNSAQLAAAEGLYAHQRAALLRCSEVE